MPFSSPAPGLKRLAREFMSRGQSLGQLWRRRSIWQVRLRWAVPPSIVVAAFGAQQLGFSFESKPVFAIAAGILAYNVLLALLFALVRPTPRRREYLDWVFAIAQVSLDYTALLLLLHFTGGLASPLVFFLIFHIIFAAMLFRPSTAYFFAAAAAVGMAALSASEELGWLASHPITYASHTLSYAQRPGHAGAMLFFFAAALFITAALSNMIMSHLRERVYALADATERVALLNDRLGSLYVMVEAVGSEKRLEHVVTTVASELTKVTEVEGVSLKLLTEDGQRLRYAAVHGVAAVYGRDREIELDKSPFNRRVIDGETVVLGQIADHAGFQLRDELLAAGIQSVILTPLRVEERIIGVLGAYRRESHQFGNEDVSFFRLAAELVALAIEDARQSEAIENLMRERTRLMVQVAHNLRAPVAAASGMVDLITGAYLGPVADKQRDYLERIAERLRGMNQTVSELLTLARTGSGVNELRREPVDLAGLVRRVEGTFRAEASRKQLEFEVLAPPGVPPVAGDGELLEQVLENLVSNSIKYTRPGGRVSLTLSAEQTLIRLDVEDNGIGIPAAEQPRLFSEFFRASNARGLAEVGTGLGMAIVNQIVKRHDGQVEVKSEQDRGTTVTIRLPAARSSIP